MYNNGMLQLMNFEVGLFLCLLFLRRSGFGDDGELILSSVGYLLLTLPIVSCRWKLVLRAVDLEKNNMMRRLVSIVLWSQAFGCIKKGQKNDKKDAD